MDIKSSGIDTTTVVSVITLVLNIIIFLINFFQTRKLYKTNWNLHFFEKIFDKYLIYKIPRNREYVRFDEQGYLKDAEKLSTCLSTLRRDALYFRFTDKKFYDELKVRTLELEDYLMENGNKSKDKDDQNKIYEQTQEKITQLYTLINKQRVGKIR